LPPPLNRDALQLQGSCLAGVEVVDEDVKMCLL
jgi:hypothetical protein